MEGKTLAEMEAHGNRLLGAHSVAEAVLKAITILLTSPATNDDHAEAFAFIGSEVARMAEDILSQLEALATAFVAAQDEVDALNRIVDAQFPEDGGDFL